jgi:hypothetical protein
MKKKPPSTKLALCGAPFPTMHGWQNFLPLQQSVAFAQNTLIPLSNEVYTYKIIVTMFERPAGKRSDSPKGDVP